MRLVVDQEIPLAVEAFSSFGDVTLVTGRELTRHQIKNADVLLVRSVTPVGAELLDGSSVRFVGTATAGIDHIDVNYLEDRGIDFFDAAGCNARAVAEFVVANVLQWLTTRPDSAIDRLRIGIVGYGNVGRCVYAMFESLGATCVVSDPPLESAGVGIEFSSLTEVLNCDVVTLHAPLTDNGPCPTANLLDSKAINALRQGTLLINAARGGIVDEAALKSWLRSNEYGTAVIDCWSGEPQVDRELMRLATVATPHIAGHTTEARIRATRMLVQALETRLDEKNEWLGPDDALLSIPHDVAVGDTLEDGLRRIILSCVDPLALTATFRQSLAFGEARRRQRFDEIRRQAVLRREFGRYIVACDRLQSDTVAALRTLGFMIS